MVVSELIVELDVGAKSVEMFVLFKLRLLAFVLRCSGDRVEFAGMDTIGRTK